MALSITAADAYISQNVIDVDDWNDSDASRKQRILNVASRTLGNRYKQMTIPDNAVYEFAPVLAAVFNDTNKLQQYGVSNFSVKGISFSFNGSNSGDVYRLIPKSSSDLIGEANGVALDTRRVGRSVR